jgi:putative peptidoglycan lipid II flippase
MPEKSAERSTGQRMGLAAVLLGASILMSRILGFLREAIIAYLFGAKEATDAYYAAFTLPDLMSYFLAGGTLSITFIPLFSSYYSKGDEEGAWRLFSTVATTMGVLMVAITIAMEVLAPWAVPILNPGFTDPAQLALAIEMTRIVIPGQLAFYLGGLLMATLFVREIFWPAALAPLVYNISIITCGLLLHPWLGIVGFSVGVVIGAFLGPLLIPLWAARRSLRFRPRFAPTDPDLRRFLLLTLPLMVGVGLVTVDEWLLRYFGSQQEPGTITWLNNARKLMLVFVAVIGQSVGQAALPFLTKLFHEGKREEMGQLLTRTLRRLLFVASITMSGLLVTAESATIAIFFRGAYTQADALQTAELLTFFALGLVGWTAQSLAARGFYAQKNTLTPMLISTSVVAVVVPAYIFLNQEFGVLGLAAATSIGITLNAAATLSIFRFNNTSLSLKSIAAGGLRGFVFSLPCAAVAYGVDRVVGPICEIEVWWHNALRLLATGSTYFVALLILATLFVPPELDIVRDKIRARLSR